MMMTVCLGKPLDLVGDGGTDAETTGADTATPVHAVRPELCSAVSNAAGLMAVMSAATALAAVAEVVTMLNSTATPLMAACRRRRPPIGASFTCVMVMAETDTESTPAMAVLKEACALLPKLAAV